MILLPRTCKSQNWHAAARDDVGLALNVVIGSERGDGFMGKHKSTMGLATGKSRLGTPTTAFCQEQFCSHIRPRVLTVIEVFKLSVV